MTSDSKARSCYWDNMKGFLIFLVVLAHILGEYLGDQYIKALYTSIYMFHMPAFVFISGYFGKSARSRSFSSIIRLAMLYFLFNSAMMFACGSEPSLRPLYSYWFLIALIVWRLTAHRIAGFRFIVPALFFIAILAGFYGAIDNTAAIARIICFYPFYMMGYLMSGEKAGKPLRHPPAVRLVCAAVCLITAACIALWSAMTFHYGDTELLMNPYSSPRYAVGRVLLFLVAGLMILALRYASVDRKIPILTMLGRNSLSIYLLHRPFTMLVDNFFSARHTMVLLAVSAAAALALCLLFGNDLAAKWLNLLASSLAGLFTDRGSRAPMALLAKLLVIAVALGYILPVIVSIVNTPPN